MIFWPSIVLSLDKTTLCKAYIDIVQHECALFIWFSFIFSCDSGPILSSAITQVRYYTIKRANHKGADQTAHVFCFYPGKRLNPDILTLIQKRKPKLSRKRKSVILALSVTLLQCKSTISWLCIRVFGSIFIVKIACLLLNSRVCFIVSGLVIPERFLDGLVGKLCPSHQSVSHLARCDDSLFNEPPFAFVNNFALSWSRTHNTVTNFYSATSQKHHQWPYIPDTTPCTLSSHGVDHLSSTLSNLSLLGVSLFSYLPLANVKIKKSRWNVRENSDYCQSLRIMRLTVLSVFESTTYLKFAKLQYVSSSFCCRMITGSLMRLN